MLLARLLVAALSVACDNSLGLTDLSKAVAGVEITPPVASITVGQVAQLIAIPKNALGDPLPGRMVTWTSSDTSVATVSATGLVTGLAAGGSATITATAAGRSANASITIIHVPVASVSITPPSASITVGLTLQLTATPRDSAGNALVGRTVTWASSNTAVATVSETGLVTGVGVGESVTITGTSDGQSGTATINVSAPPVALVVVTPASATLTLGLSQQLVATPKSAQGNPLPGRAITWMTSDPAVVTVSATGLVTGVALGGPVTITATSEGQSGTANITITAIPVASVAVAPATASIMVGWTQQLNATAKNAQGDPLPDRVITWATSDPGLATVSATGLVTGVGVGGPVTITAASEGHQASAAITVIAAPVASVTVVPATASVTVGFTQQLTATPKNALGDPLPGRVIYWTTGDANAATVSASGLVTGIAAGGPVMITATSEGQSGSAAITVTPVAVASVSVTPPTASIIVGLTQQLTATLRDAGGNALTGRTVTWSSSDPGVATVSLTGLVTGVAVGGPATITATSEGRSGTAAITVMPVPVASVSVTPVTTSLTVGLTQQLTATPRDASGNALTGRTVTWASGDPGVASVGPTGLVTGAGVGGPVTITATSEGRGGSATVTVTPSVSGPGPLRVGSSPYFFTDGSGRAVLLTGSHTWMNFQDAAFTDPPPAFNWAGYLDFLVQHNHNFMRLWRWEQANGSTETPTPNDLWFEPMPYLRPGPGSARDGRPKFNLSQFNPDYFARMRQHVIDAGQRGIYVSIMLFDGWSIEPKNGVGNPWFGHPFQRDNNVNGIDGDPNYDNQGLETHTLQFPALLALQEAYVRQVVDAVNDLDNVLYEISNESRPGAEAWEGHMIAYIKQYEAGKPKQHPVGMTSLYPAGNNADLFASAADWISPNGSMTDPPASDGRKVILNDSDHLCGTCYVEPWVWESLTRGLNPIFMDPYDGALPVLAYHDLSDPALELVRRNLGYARTYATRMNLAAMRPRGDLASSGYCLANPVAQGAEYLVYLPSGGSVTVNLSATPGTLTVEWFNPSTGQTTVGGTITGGASASFTAPTSGDAVLYLH